MVRQRSLNLVIVSAFALLVVCGPVSAVDVNGLVAYWALDEGSGTIAYDSAGDNDGMLNGSATWTSGQVGGALSFDGSGDYVQVPHDDSLTLISAGTVAAWVNLNDSYRQAIVAKHPSTSSGNYFLFTSTGRHMGFGISNGSWAELVWVPTPGDAITNEWALYVGTFDGSTVNLYENGVLVNSLPNTITPVATGQPLYIGRWQNDSDWDCDGSIDEVMIFNRCLSAQEVEDLYFEGISLSAAAIKDIEDAVAEKDSALGSIDAALEKEWEAYDVLAEMLLSGEYEGLSKRDIAAAQRKVESAIMREERSKGIVLDSIEDLEEALLLLGVEPEPNEPEPNLVAHWALDEGSGTIAYDSAGDSDGTIYGANWTSGQIDGALEFDGLDDYVSCGTGAALTGTGPFSASAWVQTGTAKGQKIMGQRSETTADGSYGTSILEDGRVQFWVYNSGYGFLFQSSVTVNDGLWHHVAVVRTNSTDGEIYVDGSLVGSGTGPVKSLNYVPVWIGGPGFTGPFCFDGKIDDVRIYDRALSGAEVEQLYQSGL